MMLLIIAIHGIPPKILAAHEQAPPPEKAADEDEVAKRVLLRVATASGKISPKTSLRDSAARSQSARYAATDAHPSASPGACHASHGSMPASLQASAAAGTSGSAAHASTDVSQAPPSAREGSMMSVSLVAHTGADEDEQADAPGYFSHLTAVAWSRPYRPFRMVVVARTLFYAAEGIFQATALYFVSDHIVIPPGMNGLTVAGFSAVTAVLVAITFAAPVGKLTATFGSVPCVVCASFIITILMCSLSFVTEFHMLLLFATFSGISICLFSVADLALIVQTLPDDESTGADMGMWNTFQYVGIAIGSAYSGAVLSMHEGTRPVAPPAMTPWPPIAPPPVPPGGLAPAAHVCDMSSCAAPPQAYYAIAGCTPPPRAPNPPHYRLRPLALRASN